MIKQIIKKTPLYILFLWGIKTRLRLIKKFYPSILKIARIDKRVPSTISITDKPVFGNKRLIVSLTSFPERVPYVLKTIYSLMNQSVKPNKIILWLSKQQFPNYDGDLSAELLYLRQYGLSIEWLEGDIRSYKKLVPAINSFPEDVIITADDDLYYPKYWIKSLINSYNENPNVIHTHCSTRIVYKDGNVSFFSRYGMKGDGSISFSNKLLGGSGTLYPPHLLHTDVTKESIFMSLAPTTDDIWFWAMALANNVKVKWIKNNMRSLYYVEGSQEDTDCLTSINDKGLRLIDSQAKKVIEYYKLYELLNQES